MPMPVAHEHPAPRRRAFSFVDVCRTELSSLGVGSRPCARCASVRALSPRLNLLVCDAGLRSCSVRMVSRRH